MGIWIAGEYHQAEHTDPKPTIKVRTYTITYYRDTYGDDENYKKVKNDAGEYELVEWEEL